MPMIDVYAVSGTFSNKRKFGSRFGERCNEVGESSANQPL
jgi:hypothetical protein